MTSTTSVHPKNRRVASSKSPMDATPSTTLAPVIIPPVSTISGQLMVTYPLTATLRRHKTASYQGNFLVGANRVAGVVRKVVNSVNPKNIARYCSTQTRIPKRWGIYSMKILPIMGMLMSRTFSAMPRRPPCLLVRGNPYSSIFALILYRLWSRSMRKISRRLPIVLFPRYFKFS